MDTNLIQKAYSSENFREEAYKLIDFMANRMELAEQNLSHETIPWTSPEEQLKFWEEDFHLPPNDDLNHLWAQLFSHSINSRNHGYMGHQVAVPPAITTLTGAVISFLNNSTTVYELGMTANAMEKVVLNYLADKFGYNKNSTGVVTSGGSIGNLTALITARTSCNIPEKDYHRLAILVSKEAHYSVERAAQIMGIPKDNIIKIDSDCQHQIKISDLEPAYQTAVAQGKKVFCVIGCAGTTAVGAYDDLEKIADFAEQHKLWFHVDGAHGAAVVFSDKYKHLLNGIERSDSLIVDFHKMLMAPALSTAVLYNHKNKNVNEVSPSASYLWQNQQSDEWYNSAKHTLECTKPITILHTYAILKRYGDALYQQHIDYLYDLGKTFAHMVKSRNDMELAVDPECNIVCFRYHPKKELSNNDLDSLNRYIYDTLLKDGEFYIVNTTIDNHFYLRVSLMNPLTEKDDIEQLLNEIEMIGFSKVF